MLVDIILGTLGGIVAALCAILIIGAIYGLVKGDFPW